MFAYCENCPVSKVDSCGEWGISTLISAAVGGVVNAVCTFASTVSLKEAGKSFVVGAVEGALSDGIPFVGTVLKIYNTAKTIYDCRKSGASWGASLLAGGVALWAGCSYGMTGSIYGDAFVDLTLGLGSSLVSTGVTEGVQRAANKNKPVDQSNSPQSQPSVVSNPTPPRGGGGGGSGAARNRVCVLY